MMLISIIIPTLNEESGLGKTITSIPRDALAKLGYNTEILVIDGDSIDLTREIATSLGARVIIEKRKGYGRAYKTGLINAKGDVIVTMDADGTYPAELIPKYVSLLEKAGIDFMTVNRFSEMENGAMTFSHRIGNRILSFAMHLLYSVNVRDSQSGMWIMTKNFVRQIKLNSDNMSMSEEIKIIAFKFFKSLEVDGKYARRIGEAKLNTIRHGWHNLRYLFEYRMLLASALNSSTVEQKIQRY